MRIGIDVGGTNTDAVVVDGVRVLASAKTATTTDVTSGIVAALRTLIADAIVQPDAVLVMPPSRLTTPEALAVVGPRAFGYDFDYRPAL
jgi:N-methylhydantoinase A/oxoprolinase/acetone carboxylase beta subunit